MLFNSIEYILFFPLVVSLYFILPYKYRWILLLTASYYFYMSWKVEYVILILASTIVDYWAALQMAKEVDKKGRRKYLLVSLMSNLGLLFGFKYFNFFSNSAREAFDAISISIDIPYFDVLLPVGISFYTFQTLSYTIDVFNGHRDPEKHLGIFALYVSFFPQLVAGPIERSTSLIPQFHRNHDFNYKLMVSGLKLMLWGFFKKLVVADRVGIYVDKIYEEPELYGGPSLLLATVLFSFQIYCDFSGYSDIAIGTARTMGYDLMENFRRPYFSRSISEFWRRWHISLSTWFRDYVYIPLGGNRVSTSRWYINLFIVFIVSGLWHGANWTFVAWGALHGVYLILAIAFKPLSDKLAKTLPKLSNSWMYDGWRILTTYALVLIAWTFFRADTITDGFYIAIEILKFKGPLFFQGDFQIHLAYSFIAILLLLAVEVRQEYFPALFHSDRPRLAFRNDIAYAILAAIILLLGTFDGGQFIYFQF